MADRTPLKIKNNRITQFETSDSLGLVFGGTGTDLSLTGGVGQFLRQSSAGAAITVSAIAHADLGSGGGTGSKYLRDDMTWQTVSAGVTDHGSLTGLADDDHTQYALLAGRSGGQTLIGGTGSGDDLTLRSTSHATKGNIFFGTSGTHTFDEVNRRWGFGTGSPAYPLHVVGTSYFYRIGGGQIYVGDGSTIGSIDYEGLWFRFYINGSNFLTINSTALTYSPSGTQRIIFGASGVRTDNGNWMLSGNIADAAARKLEVRSTSAQQRWSYDASNYAEISVNSTGQLVVSGAGSRYTAIAIGGASALAATDNQIAIGYLATTSASEAIAIGRQPTAASGTVAIGHSANGSTYTAAVLVGKQTSVTGNDGIAIGYGASAAGQSIAIGLSAAATGGTESIALGRTSTTTAAGQFVAGGTSGAITDVYFGKGVTHATPTAWTLNGTGGSGTNISGGNLILAPGKPSGAGSPGNLLIQFAPAGASGTTLGTLATYADWRIGGLMLGTSGAAARALEVRSTSAQIRASYSGSVYGEWAVDSAGTNTFSCSASPGNWVFGGGFEIYDLTATSGERRAGGMIRGTGTYDNLILGSQTSGTSGVQIVYNNGSQFYSALEIDNVGSGLGEMRLMKSGGVVGIGTGSGAPATLLELEQLKLLTFGVSDGYSAALTLDPGYTGAFTVDRHNYIDAQNVSTAASAVVTDAALVRFDAAAGTHKAVDSGTTKTTPGAVDAWVKININGTIYYLPAYTSKTT